MLYAPGNNEDESLRFVSEQSVRIRETQRYRRGGFIHILS